MSPLLPAVRGYRRVRLLAIGIDHYTNTDKLPPLKGAQKDAQDVASLFERLFPSEASHSPSISTKLLLAEQATKEAVEKELISWAVNAGPVDLHVVFFAGHGLRRITNGIRLTTESGICLVDYQGDQSWEGFVTSKQLWTWLALSCARHKLLIFDCCDPALGLRRRGTSGDHQSWRRLWENPAVQVLAAADFNQPAWDLGSGSGLFTRQLIRGLEGAVFDECQRDWVTLCQLGSWLRGTVSHELEKIKQERSLSPDIRQDVQYGYVDEHADDVGQVIFVRPGKNPKVPLTQQARIGLAPQSKLMDFLAYQSAAFVRSASECSGSVWCLRYTGRCTGRHTPAIRLHASRKKKRQ